MFMATGTTNHHLAPKGATFVRTINRLEPDESFGPRRNLPGAQLPQGFSDWGEYHTLKVEIGISQGWPALDRKVSQWWPFPGLRYIICIRVSPRQEVQQFKFYTVNQNAPPQLNPTVIANPTIIGLDSRVLLGLQPGAPLPVGFADPNVIIDLFEVVQEAIAQI
ncbi:hypothetical protein THRCLA_04644 [Thraustotheca clavata]|uniref:Uncharacterized protein n=1 Tax=Thraustotheca clavata TaxID=74557 RepID=A0A1V9ZZ36_9STRA|nr:hypothetical protein THRCLA_04644 [Thraustotheca clavata]